jgi:hypothetical protein
VQLGSADHVGVLGAELGDDPLRDRADLGYRLELDG